MFLAVRLDIWESVEIFVIEANVREVDERFMSAAVMPFESTLGGSGTHEILKDAFRIFIDWHSLVVHLQIHLATRHLKKVSRWQLLGITNHYKLSPACDGANSVFRGKLRRLVKDHQVKRRV